MSSGEPGGGSGALRFFAADDFVRRSRWVIALLMINWVALGLVVGATLDDNMPLAVAAAIAGVLTIAAGAGQLRAARFAASAPIAEIVDGRLRVRYYSSRVFRSVPLSKLQSASRRGGILELTGHDGEKQAIALRGLGEDDRQSLVDALGQQIAAQPSAPRSD